MNTIIKLKNKMLERKQSKIITLLIVTTLFVTRMGMAQITINEDEASGDANAELDVQSTTKGIVFPVMSVVERDAIKSPVAGLLIFNRSDGYHNCYDGSNWQQINRALDGAATNPLAGTGTDVGVGVGVADPDNSAILHVNSVTKGFLLPRLSAFPTAVTGMIFFNTNQSLITYYNSNGWTTTLATSSSAGAGGTETAAGVLIGTGTISAPAKMEVRSTSKGILIPRMDNTQRNAIDTPLDGLTLYNTTENNIEYYFGGSWYNWLSAPLLGMTQTDPGQSCKDIYDNNVSSQGVNGTYWIDPDGVGPNSSFECTCDMTTDGGGWTLVTNTGPKKTNIAIPAAVGSNPFVTTIETAFEKMSDANINLLRGGPANYATSILRLDRPNGSASAFPMYFVQNTVFKANASNGEKLKSFYENYNDAVTTTNIQVPGNGFGSALSTWGGGLSNPRYMMIWTYGSEGIITNANNTCGGTAANNRSECNALLWVKAL